MSSWDKDLDDWLRGFFSGSGRIGLPTLGRGGRGWFGGDMPRQSEEMRREMERELAEQFKGIETTAPKVLVREYQTPSRSQGKGSRSTCLRIFNDNRPRQ